MKFSKILLIVGIVALVFTFAMSTSSAASSEKITKFKMYDKNSYNKKIVTIDKSYSLKNNRGVEYISSYKISIKNKYKGKYKIKSVNMTYQYYDENSYKHKNIYYNYNGKNKNTIKIKDPKKSIIFQKMTINYYTKGKIKKESTKFQLNSNYKTVTYYYGNKANVKLNERGYNKLDSTFNEYLPRLTYTKFKVTTKNKKYKIKKVQAVYYDDTGLNSIKTYNGYGKNSLTIKPNEKKYLIWIGEFRVFYY